MLLSKGDVNSDGRVDATDRSIVVGDWTGSGYTMLTDLELGGTTDATDRSLDGSGELRPVEAPPQLRVRSAADRSATRRSMVGRSEHLRSQRDTRSVLSCRVAAPDPPTAAPIGSGLGIESDGEFS